MAVNRVKWGPYCAEKGFTGRIFRPGASNREHGTLQALTPRKRVTQVNEPVNPLDRQLEASGGRESEVKAQTREV